MSVTVQDTTEVRRIDILGEFDDPAQGAALLAALNHAGGRRLELTFYDARTLPGEVLEKLLGLCAAAIPLKIHTYHGYLLHHLMRLGLPALGRLTAASLPPAPPVAALALGGSADSLDKILAIVEALPPSNTTVFVVQHILENERNYLDSLLRARTEYTVEMPQHMTEIQPGTLYVAPPAHHMKVAHGRVYLTRDQKVNFARPSIDVLFKSVAEEYRERALVVLLCGYGCDGIKGLAAVKAGGGCVLVENSGECGARDLTDAGAAGGVYDHIFSLAELRCFIAAAVAGRGKEYPAQLIDLLLEAVFARYGYDYRNYQRSTVERRLDNLRNMMGAVDFFTLQREILTDPDAFERLFLELSINVTAFFRHPEQFKVLRESILPYLDSFPHIKIWSAGCANGKEAYSLAILLDELGMLHKSQIFATDINPYQLEEGKNGLYPLEMLEEGQRNHAAAGGHGRLENWMEVGRSHVKVASRLRKHMLFYPHSLVHDGPFNEFQLILCRNVLIYFHPELQRRVMELFSRSLHRDGFLVLGASESLGQGNGEQYFAPYRAPEKIYRWRSGGIHDA
ncbi:MAG: CheR family methyltransferase [Sulfuricellaceae bacterium]